MTQLAFQHEEGGTVFLLSSFPRVLVLVMKSNTFHGGLNGHSGRHNKDIPGRPASGTSDRTDGHTKTVRREMNFAEDEEMEPERIGNSLSVKKNGLRCHVEWIN